MALEEVGSALAENRGSDVEVNSVSPKSNKSNKSTPQSPLSPMSPLGPYTVEEARKEVMPVAIHKVQRDITIWEDESVRRFLLRYEGTDIPSGWKEGPAKDGIQVEVGDLPDTEWHTLKTTARINVPAELVVDALRDLDNIPRYDEMIEKVTTLEVLSEHTEARHVTCKSVMFTSARDFCVTTTMRKLADGRYVIATRSIVHPLGKRGHGFVRAISHISGFMITPVEGNPNACDVAVVAHMDLGGYVPAMVIRYIGLSAPIKMMETVQTNCIEWEKRVMLGDEAFEEQQRQKSSSWW